MTANRFCALLFICLVGVHSMTAVGRLQALLESLKSEEATKLARAIGGGAFYTYSLYAAKDIFYRSANAIGYKCGDPKMHNALAFPIVAVLACMLIAKKSIIPFENLAIASEGSTIKEQAIRATNMVGVLGGVGLVLLTKGFINKNFTTVVNKLSRIHISFDDQRVNKTT